MEQTNQAQEAQAATEAIETKTLCLVSLALPSLPIFKTLKTSNLRYNHPQKKEAKSMKDLIIYEDAQLYVQQEQSTIPWLKIFTKEPYKELGDLPKSLRLRVWEVYDIIEYEMKSYYQPEKINMASFANMLPRVHIHVMARFKEDSHFPNSMWGEKLRDSKVTLPDEEQFHRRVFSALTNSQI